MAQTSACSGDYTYFGSIFPADAGVAKWLILTHKVELLSFLSHPINHKKFGQVFRFD